MNRASKNKREYGRISPIVAVSVPLQPESVVTTLPAVPTTENGTGTGAATTAWYDREGNLTWSQDADGFLTLNQYDATTGLLMETVRNVDTGHLPATIANAMDTVAAPDYPHTSTPVATPLGDATSLNVTTNYSYDNQGRLVQTLGPVHNADIDGATKSVRSASWTVYEDAIHQVISREAINP